MIEMKKSEEEKMVRVPFDINMAKGISSRLTEGRIITRDGHNVRIICWNAKTEYPIIALKEVNNKLEMLLSLHKSGTFMPSPNEPTDNDLFLEVPKCASFKDGDVIVLNSGDVILVMNGPRSIARTYGYRFYCILNRLGTLQFPKDKVNEATYMEASGSRKATDSEKQRLLDALEASRSKKAKKIVEQFFNGGAKPKPEKQPALEAKPEPEKQELQEPDWDQMGIEVAVDVLAPFLNDCLKRASDFVDGFINELKKRKK